MVARFAILIPSIFVRHFYPQYTNSWSMNNRKSVIVRPPIPVHALIKAVSVAQD